MSFSGGARPGAGLGLGGAASARGGLVGGPSGREVDDEGEGEGEGEGEDEGSEGERPARGFGFDADDGGATTPRALQQQQQQAYDAEYAPGPSAASRAVPVSIPGSRAPSLGATPAHAAGPAPGSSYASTAASSSYSAALGTGVRAPPNSAAPAPGGAFPSPPAAAAAAVPQGAEEWSSGLDARLSQLDLGGPAPSSSTTGAPSLSLAPVALGSGAPALGSPLSPPIPMPSTTSSSTSTSTSTTSTSTAAAPRPPTARRPSARSDTLASVPELPFAHALSHSSAPGAAPGRARDRSGSSATRLSVSPSVGAGGGLSAVSSSEEDEPLYVEAQRVVPAQQQQQAQGGLGAPAAASSAAALQQQQQQHVAQQVQLAPAPQPDDPNKVILAGYLMKQGKRRNWRKRWFVLQSGMLMYSRSHMVRRRALSPSLSPFSSGQRLMRLVHCRAQDTKHSRQIPLSSIVDAIEAPSHAHFPSSPSLSGAPSSPLSPPSSSSTSPHDAAPPASSSSSSSGPTPDNTFKIITPSRTFLVCAPSEEDEIKWLAALQCLVARRTAQALQPPPAPAPAPAAPAALQQPEVARRPSQQQQPQRPTAHGRQRSVTDAARQAVRDVERRFHPGSYAASHAHAHGQQGAAAA